MGTSRIVVFAAVSLGLCVVAGVLAWSYATRPAPATCAPGGVDHLRMYLAAQSSFQRHVRYGSGERRFANPRDGVGFSDLYYLAAAGDEGGQLGLIAKGLADATGPESAYSGFYFVDITSGPGGEYDFGKECGLCAVPCPYEPGRLTFIVDVTGTVWEKDNGGRPVTRFPSSPDEEGWKISGR